MSIRNTKKEGFTLIEMIISLAFFSAVVLVGSAALLGMSAANQKTRATRTVLDNLGFSLEDMSYLIRSGESYHCDNTGNIGSPRDCAPSNSLGSNFFALEGPNGDSGTNDDQIIYRLTYVPSGRGEIQKSTNGGFSYFPITSPDIDIKEFTIFVTGSDTLNDEVPRVIISIKGVSGAEKATTETALSIQTTITQDRKDILVFGPSGNYTCDDVYVYMVEDEIYVYGTSPLADGTIMNDSTAGYYEMYYVDPAESGASQLNESFYVLMNGTPPLDAPNCIISDGTEVLVIQDPYNYDPPTGPIYIGTFILNEGANTINLRHYCPVWKDGLCQEFHNDSNNSGCQTNNPNSVHFLSSGSLCVYRVGDVAVPGPSNSYTCNPGYIEQVEDEIIVSGNVGGINNQNGTILNNGDPGLYEIYYKDPAESGAAELNESFYVLINGYPPQDSSTCTDQYGEDVLVIQDPYNSGPPAGPTYIGTFFLRAGTNNIEVFHYCPTWRAGLCQGFHNDSDVSGCQTNNENSIHFLADNAFCIKKVE